MSQPRLVRAHLAPRVALALALCAALLFAVAAPASAITRKQAAGKALTALGVRNGSSPVIVFGLTKPLPANTRVTGKAPRIAMTVGRDRAFFFYQDSGPFRLYPHTGRIALVGAKSGRVKLSKAIARPPLVNGKLPAFLKTSKGYRASQYRVFSRLGITLAQPPKAEKQDVTVKQNRSKAITLTATTTSADYLTFTITQPPSHGTLSGQPPNMVYTPDPDYLGKDKFGFKANDNTSQSNTAHITIDVIPLGQPPVTTTSAGCTAYDARAAAVVVDGLAGVSDPDDTTLSSATVRISSGFQEGDDLLFTDQNGITGAYDDTTGALTLTGDASVANYQAALRSVRYRNLSTGTPSASKTVEFTANDGGTDSAAATKQLCLTVGGGGANHRPIGETISEGALVYTENDGPVAVDAGFIAVDPDSATLSGATVKFIPSQASQDEEGGGGGGSGGTVFNFFPAEDRLAFADQNGITGNYNAATGELTLSGTASVANYQAALQSVTYENTSENPTPDPRTIRFQLTDSSGASSVPSTRDISVTPVNDAPVVTPSDGSAPYTEGDPLTTIDSGLTVGDVDNTTLQGGQVRISSGFQSGDELGFVGQNGISGSYNPGTGVLTLTGAASVAEYQAALQSIQYRGTSDNPSSSKTVEFVVNDGELDSAAATKDIAVTPVNDQPVLTTTGAALPFVEGSGPVAIDPGVTATDPDSTTLSGATVQITGNFSLSQDSLGFTAQSGISGFYDTESGILTLSGTASVAAYETALRSVTYNNTSDNPSADTRTVTFQANDGELSNNLSDPVTRDIEITPVNDGPVVTTTLGSTPYTQGDTTGVAVDNAVTAVDVDDTNIESAKVRISSGFQSGDELVFVDQPGISGAYNTGTGVLTLSGSALAEDYQTALQSIRFRTTNGSPSTPKTVEFVVNDGDTDSNAATKPIDITAPPADSAPVVTTSTGPVSYGSGDAAVTVDSGVTATDSDDTNIESAKVRISSGFTTGDELVYANQPGISGAYNALNGELTLTGSATVADYQTALQSIQFQDGGGNASTSRTIEFVVNDGDLNSDAATRSIDIGPGTP